MNKDIPITLISFSSKGDVISYVKELKNAEYAPIISRNDDSWFYSWWTERAIPLTRNNLTSMLKSRNIDIPEEYLFKNLGLSLNDCYWIKPLDSGLKWKDVNLFTNSFKDNSLEWEKGDSEKENIYYSPNSSLTGGLEKTWVIKKGERYLIKGNVTERSDESLNEVIASKIHKSQGYNNFVDYSLVKIKNKPYDYGCCCKCFTSEKVELVTAYDLILSKPKKNTDSYYEHLIKVCVENGLDEEEVRMDLEYLILTDYVMSQRDRHFNNIGFLRDSDTLKFIGTAPIYDSGESFYANTEAPKSEGDMKYLYTKGFEQNSDKMLKLVKNPMLINLDKLPPASAIRKIYEKDSKQKEEHLNGVCFAYEKRIEMCRRFQIG